MQFYASWLHEHQEQLNTQYNTPFRYTSIRWNVFRFFFAVNFRTGCFS